MSDVELFSNEREIHVLAKLLISASVSDCELKEEDFYFDINKTIYRAMIEVDKKGLEVEIFTVAEYAGFETQAGMSNLNKIFELHEISDSEYTSYCEKLRELTARRSYIKEGEELIRLAYDKTASLDEIQALTASNAEKLNVSTDIKYSSLNDVLKGCVDVIDERFNSDGSLTGLDCGINAVNDICSGLNPGLIVLAARPAMGKSAFAMNLVENIVSKGNPVLVFNLEMPAQQVAMRMLSSVGRIDATRVRDGSLQEEDWPKLASAANKLFDAPLTIIDNHSLNCIYIKKILKGLDHKPKLIVIDYLQLMQGNKTYRANERVAEVSEITRELKKLSMELNIPVVVLSQLNRGVEQRPNKRPINSDLRESGSIEQDADLVWFLYRDEYYFPDITESPGIAELITSKNRHGDIGTTLLTWTGRYLRFEGMEYNGYES